MNQTFCRAAHDRPARILPAAINHRKNAPPGVVGRRSGYALAPPGHPRQESHPDCRCRLTLIVAGHTACWAFRPGRYAYCLGGRSASKIGSSTSIAAVMQTRSRKVEMPNGLSLPLAFGMNTLLIGSGR